jgi:hypothetical protein
MKTSAAAKKPIATTVEKLAGSVPDVADAINTGERFVWNLIRQGKLEVSRVGGRTLVIWASVKRLLEENKQRPPKVTPRRERRLTL